MLAQIAVALLAAAPQQLQTKMVSVSSTGAPATSDCGVSSISADGRFVAFWSYADDLVVGDTNGTLDVFVIDRATGVPEIADVDSNGVQANGGSAGGMLSADGRYVAFGSAASNLVPNDGNNFDDIFVRDRVGGRTWRLSVDSHGAEANLPSYPGGFTPDGRYLAFTSSASNLVAGDTNGAADAFVHDLWTGTTERVSVSSSGIEGDRASDGAPEISDDGRFVGFSSQATNLAGFDGNKASDAFVRDRWTGTTIRTSVSVTGGDPNRESFGGVTRDGHFAVVASNASNLVAGDTNQSTDIFLRDLKLAKTVRVSVGTNGTEANGPSYSADVTADGSVVVFTSQATNLFPGDTNGVDDLFMRDLRTGTTTRIVLPPISVSFMGAGTTLTPDGSVVAFNGYDNPGAAPILVSGQPYSYQEVFVLSPYLQLSAEPQLVPPAGEVTMAVWDGGAPHGFGIIAAVAVNGVPTLVPFSPVNFDGEGRFHRTFDAPASFAGSGVEFAAAAYAADGSFQHTNHVTVTFQ
jgi:Tol biopolymer transport system component